MPLTPEQLSKLPKYAQIEINRLARNAAWMQDQINALNDPNGTVSWSIGLLDEKDHGLPERATITFKTPTGRIEIDYRDGELIVSGDGGISVRPSVSNVIHIRAGE